MENSLADRPQASKQCEPKGCLSNYFQPCAPRNQKPAPPGPSLVAVPLRWPQSLSTHGGFTSPFHKGNRLGAGRGLSPGGWRYSSSWHRRLKRQDHLPLPPPLPVTSFPLAPASAVCWACSSSPSKALWVQGLCEPVSPEHLRVGLNQSHRMNNGTEAWGGYVLCPSYTKEAVGTGSKSWQPNQRGPFCLPNN